MSVPKPFQDAAVDAAMAAFANEGGRRRFLVADEVGLGKTVVAKEVARRMSDDGRVFRTGPPTSRPIWPNRSACEPAASAFTASAEPSSESRSDAMSRSPSAMRKRSPRARARARTIPATATTQQRPHAPMRFGAVSTPRSGLMCLRRRRSGKKASTFIPGAPASYIGIYRPIRSISSSARAGSSGTPGWRFEDIWRDFSRAKFLPRTWARGRPGSDWRSAQSDLLTRVG